MLQSYVATHTKESSFPYIFWSIRYRSCYLDQPLTHSKTKMEAGKVKTEGGVQVLLYEHFPNGMEQKPQLMAKCTETQHCHFYFK